MKKTLVSTLSVLMILGSASTTFAAENPFSDVPADHWSRQMLARLAQEGVIEGYEDNTFRGDAKLTRYEMAQIVAKAMAKSNLSTTEKVQLDKLAAEYIEELNNLGVRVTELEKKSDNLKIGGLLRLDTRKDKITKGGTTYKDTTKSTGRLRLEPTASINENWQVKARIDYDTDLKAGTGGNGTLKMAYATGDLLGGKVSVGKVDYADFENMTAAYGFIFDNYFSGAKAVFGDQVKVTLAGGRMDAENTAYTYGGLSNYPSDSLDYTGIQITDQLSDKLILGAAYHSLRDAALYKKQSILEFAADYKLSNTLRLGGVYAKSNLDAAKFALSSDKEERAYTVQLDYKGINRSAPGSFGLWAAYRELGNLAVVAPTYVANFNGEKGYEIGAKYVLDKNIIGQITYFAGEKISNERDVKRVFGRFEFRF